MVLWSTQILILSKENTTENENIHTEMAGILWIYQKLHQSMNQSITVCIPFWKGYYYIAYIYGKIYQKFMMEWYLCGLFRIRI